MKLNAAGGKGSSPRPVQNREAFDKNWDAIFGKKETKEDDCCHCQNCTCGKKKES